MAKNRKRNEAAASSEHSDGNGNGNGYHADRIAARAYELYLERGGGDGNDVGDWLEAERQVREATEPDAADK